ncbi:MAG TPA: efflux RND transporter periplasmic adaptor subunit [Gemmatimonadales bacterium]
MALLAAGCSSGAARSDTPAAGRRPGGGEGSAVPVAVAPTERRTLARSVTLTAPVEPLRRIGVNSQMTGTVLDVLVQEGDRVSRGDLMAVLDTREMEAQLDRSRATLANAQAAFRRASEMHDARIITQAEFEQTRAAFETARSDVRLWETRFGFGRILAPAAGVVTAKIVEAGSAVSPNQRMFELADESLLVVRVQVSELDVVNLSDRVRVRVALDAYPNAPGIPGRVRRIFPSADPISRLVPVEIALGTPPAGVVVRPGYLARVTLDLEDVTNTLAVPEPAIGTGAEGAYVFVVTSDTLVQRSVSTGLSAGGWVQIAAGLDSGEQVVVSGFTNLRQGSRVLIAESPRIDSSGSTP